MIVMIYISWPLGRGAEMDMDWVRPWVASRWVEFVLATVVAWVRLNNTVTGWVQRLFAFTFRKREWKTLHFIPRTLN